MGDESREGSVSAILEGCMNNAEALQICSTIKQWEVAAVLLLDSTGTLHGSAVGSPVELAAQASVLGVFRRYFDDIYLILTMQKFMVLKRAQKQKTSTKMLRSAYYTANPSCHSRPGLTRTKPGR
jgi:hypothetical protein